jgi:hypothetical protein
LAAYLTFLPFMSLNNCSKSFHTSEVLLRPRLWHIVSVLAVLAVAIAVDGVAAVPVPVSASKAISRPVELKVRGSATANDWLLLLSIRFEFPSIEMVADSSWPLVLSVAAAAGTHGRTGGRGGRETPCPGGRGGAGGCSGRPRGGRWAGWPWRWRHGCRLAGLLELVGAGAAAAPVALGRRAQGRRAQRRPRLRSRSAAGRTLTLALGRRDARAQTQGVGPQERSRSATGSCRSAGAGRLGG